MTTIILHSHHHHENPEPQFDSHSSPVHHETPEEEPEDTSKTDQKQQEQQEELSAEFIAECERLGVPLSAARKLQRRNQAKHDYYWRDMQMAVSKDSSNKVGVEGGDGVRKTLKIADDVLLPIRRSSAKDVSSEPPVPKLTQEVVESAQQLLLQTKAEALDALQSSQGDTTNPRFLAALQSLASLYRGMRDQPGAEEDLSSNFEGTWRIVSKPNFKDGLGQNRRGDFVYTMGRMSFGMFRPNDLRCSIQRILNTTAFVGPDDELPDSVPKSLRQEIHELRETMRNSGTVDITGGEGPILRTYDIEVEFSIETTRTTTVSSHLGGDCPQRVQSAVQVAMGGETPTPHLPSLSEPR